MKRYITIFILLVSALSLASAQTVTVDPAFTQNGKSMMIDAGGHRINMLVAGEGSLTVVLEAGIGSGIQSWGKVYPEVARFARVVAYDRAGTGQSEPGPAPRTAEQIAKELHTALKNAGLAPPYLLVGHSLGGLYIRVFAGLYPNEVAGLVLIDPLPDGIIEWLKTNRPEDWKKLEEALSKATQNVSAEIGSLETTMQQARATSLPDVPITLITGARSDPPYKTGEILQAWMTLQKEWLKQVPSARYIVTEKSGHFIQNQEPELVADAIRQMVAAASRKQNPNQVQRLHQRL
jgi:pimeloyl-ACP methyl ester carboxylesterase